MRKRPESSSAVLALGPTEANTKEVESVRQLETMAAVARIAMVRVPW